MKTQRPSSWPLPTRESGVVGVAHAGEGPLRVPPRELAVVELRARASIRSPQSSGISQAVVDGVGGARRDQPHVGHRPRGPGVALVDGVAALVEHAGCGRSARRARPGRGRRPRTSPLWKSVRPFASTASSSTQTSKASTVPPGKKWPTLRVRTTTSTRTDSPRRSGAVHRAERAPTTSAAARRARARPRRSSPPPRPTAKVLAQRAARRSADGLLARRARVLAAARGRRCRRVTRCPSGTPG